MKKVRLINVNPKHRRYGKTADVPESVLDKPKLEEDGWRLQGYIGEDGDIISPNKKANKPVVIPPLIDGNTPPKLQSPALPVISKGKGGRPKGQGKGRAPAKPKDKKLEETKS